MPNDWPDYELIDFGDSRRLERFGRWVIDRPCPAAAHQPRETPGAWRDAHARYTGARTGDGKWRLARDAPAADDLVEAPIGDVQRISLRVQLTPAGQVGLFPEQLPNWRWIASQVARAKRPLRVLNLFAYTGGSTLAAAAAGAEVTHVDASKPSVNLARENAAASSLGDASVRWIVEDALRYCRREVKRGAKYDAAILDPPSYGHGPKGEEWKLTRDLPALLELVRELVAPTPVFLLATCHTPGVGPAELGAYLADGVFGSCARPPSTGELRLTARDGRRLESGVYARWPR